MKEHPILFNTDMVKAILDGRKTQTRRIVKDKQIAELNDSATTRYEYKGYLSDEENDIHVIGRHWKGSYVNCYHVVCPYRIGDRLWVRETFLKDSHGFHSYLADYGTPKTHVTIYDMEEGIKLGMYWKKPSIYMPKSASRITLEITDIRIERVNDISNEDAIAEGISPVREEDPKYPNFINPDTFMHFPKYSFFTLWDVINLERGFGTHENPWVWVYTFKVIKPEKVGE